MPQPTIEISAQKRPWRHFALFAILVVLAFSALWAVEWDITSLTDSVARAKAWERAKLLISAFAEPDFSSEWLSQSFQLTLETLSAAVIAVCIGLFSGYLLGMAASRAVIVGEENAKGWQRWNPFRHPLAVVCSVARLILDTLRAVPDFAWAVILVAMLGLGPMTGAIALGLNVTGILGKVYSEFWDNVEPKRYEQIRALGGGRLKTFLYGIRPLASRSVQSFTLMRAECAIRNAAVIGAIGGGGLGSEIKYQIGMGGWDKVTTLILFTLMLTLTADLASNFIRRQLRNDPNHPRAIRSRSTFASLSRSYVGMSFALILVLWALWFMGWGNSSGHDGQAKNYLQPVIANVTSAKEIKKLAFFEDLLEPRFDLQAFGDDAAEDQQVQVFSDYGPTSVFNTDAWASWNKQLSKWFIWRVLKSALIPLSMAIIGTLLGVFGAIVLTYQHSMAFQLESQQFTGETPSLAMRAFRFSQLTVARLIGLVSRGVPEIMWAFLFIAFFGPTLIAGTLAIALHT
ncbi:MAG: ABC transporter permease subunit, partial [Planctomycetota bacterium]